MTDPGVRKAGLVAPLEEKLREAHIAYEIYDEVVPDPGVAEVQRAYERAMAVGADAFVAVGGGSSIDTAKMAAVLLTNGGTVLDYIGMGQLEAGTVDQIVSGLARGCRRVPLPLTACTGQGSPACSPTRTG